MTSPLSRQRVLTVAAVRTGVLPAAAGSASVRIRHTCGGSPTALDLRSER